MIFVMNIQLLCSRPFNFFSRTRRRTMCHCINRKRFNYMPNP